MAEPKAVQDLATRSNLLGVNGNSTSLNFEMNLEAILPKYDLSAGRDDFAGAHLSMARLYFDDIGEVFHALGDREINSFSGSNGTYIGFLIQTVTENRQEKVQTSPLAGDSSHTTFFGGNPLQYAYSGVLINGSNVRWREVFTKLYTTLLRGTAAVSKGRPVKVVYDNKVVSGWVVSMSQNLSSANEMVIPFNFTLQVMDEIVLTSDESLRSSLLEYTQLGNNDAYFGITSTNSELPMDDYTRKASIRLPPKAIRGGGSSGSCKVKPPTESKYGQERKTTGANGPVKQDSPTRTKCDMAEALLVNSRRRSKALANRKNVLASTSLSESAKKKKIAIYDRQLDAAEKNLTNLQGWAKRENVEGLSEYNQVLTDAKLTDEEKSSVTFSTASTNKLSKVKRNKKSKKLSSAAKNKRKSKEV
jgi:hypothetical protein